MAFDLDRQGELTTRKLKKRRSGPKLRVGLEKTNYDGDFEFPAEAPGRVIVRLERLMGTDRIRITDLKYMATFLQRLEEEEDVQWRKRTWERRKAEHNRFRQLVINGYTEPGPGMEDLTNHPIFRVNLILNRLSKLNENKLPIMHLPPMFPVEPFEEDDTGGVFKTYPGHVLFAQELEQRSQSHVALMKKYSSQLRRSQRQRVVQISGLEFEDGTKAGLGETEVEDLEANEVEGEEEEGAYNIANSPYALLLGSKKSFKKRVSMMNPESHQEMEDYNKEGSQEPKTISIKDIQEKYGIAPDVDLGVQWKPYRSELVETLFTDENRGVLDLYEMGDGIVGLYNREQLTADDYLAAIDPYHHHSSRNISEEMEETELADQLEKMKSIYSDLYDDDEFWRYIEERRDDDSDSLEIREPEYDDNDDDEDEKEVDLDDTGYEAGGE